MTANRPPFVGPAYSRRELLESEFLTRQEVRRVRAYRVPALIGAVVAAPSERLMPTAIERLLGQRLLPFAWQVEPRVDQALRKYGFIHTSVPAPPDPSGEPMWLELAGDVIAFGGSTLEPGTRWLDVRPVTTDERMDTEVAGPIAIVLTVATYANTSYPGVGVPFYL